MKEKKYSKLIVPFLLLAAISVLSFYMNKYRIGARHFIFPAALFVLPLAFDGKFRPKDISKPSKEGLFLFLWVTLAVIVFYPPLFFAYNLGFMHRNMVTPASSELVQAVIKGLIAIAVAAVPEEFFFRGYLQEHVFAEFDRKILKTVSLKNLFTSILFGLVHALAFLDATRAATFFPSLLFGLFTEKSRGRIFYSISFHVVSNILAFILWTFVK
ncbi:CPBP family intramembrane metalloprotease [bacterium]|nr:CPBP family intramembrane metalloprotease [bacterium]